MPEFYKGGNSEYQKSAQRYLDAIAVSFRDDPGARSYLLQGTIYSKVYEDSSPLWNEQWMTRDPINKMKCAFWANYWYEPCKNCTCRITSSVSMEIDAMFFLTNSQGNILALHVEMKRDGEAFSIGQAEAYMPRAECFRDERRVRKSLMRHDHFLTVLFHGYGTDLPFVQKYFDRVIDHNSARRVFQNYPSR